MKIPTPNPNAVKIILNVAGFFIVTILVVILLFGCSPSKQAARKDKAALERVTAKRALIDSVAPIVFGLYPCANDTFTTFLSGGIDSVPYPVPVLDTAARKQIIDSLGKLFLNDCYAAVEASYEAGYNNAIIDLKDKKVPVKRPDTLVNSIVDRQKHDQYEKAIQAAGKKAAALEASNYLLGELITKQEKQTNKWLWLFIAACVALGLTNGLWVYSKIKNPFR